MGDFWIFVILSIINVIVGTAKSIMTVKSGKALAATINAISYGFYTGLIVYTVAPFPLWEKVLIISATNFIGVYIVKAIEERVRKDKLWKVELTIPFEFLDDLVKELEQNNISYNYMTISDNEHIIFNIYCPTQNESALVKEIVQKYGAKYFVSEINLCNKIIYNNFYHKYG